MASHAPLTSTEEHGQYFNKPSNEENNIAPALPSHEDASNEHIPQRESLAAPEPADEVYTTPRSTPKEPSSTENRLRPAAGNRIHQIFLNHMLTIHLDVINRIIWDSNFDSEDYIIGYEDRFNGCLEASLGSWKKDLTDEEFIPQHRILYIKRKSDAEIVWDKRRRTDKIFNSGNSAYSWLSFLS